jgi:hypothetical protein
MLLMSRITRDAYAPFGARTVYKGGGGTTTTVSGIDKEFKPYLKEVLKDVTGKYKKDRKKGADSVVAKMTEEQGKALQRQKKYAGDMMRGTGIYDTRGAEERSLQNVAGQYLPQSYTGGALGSARSQAAMQGALANRAGEYQQQRQDFAKEGVKSLGEVGSAKQQYKQARLDAPHTLASRYFGYLAGAPQSSVQTTSGGGK